MANLFTDHPSRAGETYFQHMRAAFHISSSLLIGSMVCFIHAFLPFLFQKTTSTLLFKTIDYITQRTAEIKNQ